MRIAKTVQAIDAGTNPVMKRIMDRSQPLTLEFAEQVISLTQFMWHGRRPKPSIAKNGSERSTNLDLMSWLVGLSKRRATISLPDYGNQLPWKARAGEQRVGNQKPHGPIVGLISHREHLSFSVRINDQSILNHAADETRMGAHRSYMIADHAGRWSDGWHGFDWDKTSEEQAYLDRRSLMVGGKVPFTDYLHQNRRQSIYGAPYLLLKLFWQRIEDEIAFYESELKRLEKAGVASVLASVKGSTSTLASGESRSAEVPVFTMQVNGPEFTGEYKETEISTAGLAEVQVALQLLKQTLRPMIQFVVRADEVAFYRFGLEQGFVSAWIKGTSWKYDTTYRAQTMMLGDSLSISYKKSVTEMRLAA